MVSSTWSAVSKHSAFYTAVLELIHLVCLSCCVISTDLSRSLCDKLKCVGRCITPKCIISRMESEHTRPQTPLQSMKDLILARRDLLRHIDREYFPLARTTQRSSENVPQVPRGVPSMHKCSAVCAILAHVTFCHDLSLLSALCVLAKIR